MESLEQKIDDIYASDCSLDYIITEDKIYSKLND